MRIHFPLFLGVALTGCGALPAFDPTTSVTHVVRATSDSSKTVTIPDGMVWYDSPQQSSGIRFPAGTYTLEAEDDDYWYFRSPAPLEFRSFVHGKATHEHTNPGGLMLGKHSLSLVPAGGYVDGDGSNKSMIWKLDRGFLAMQGKQWRKSF